MWDCWKTSNLHTSNLYNSFIFGIRRTILVSKETPKPVDLKYVKVKTSHTFELGLILWWQVKYYTLKCKGKRNSPIIPTSLTRQCRWKQWDGLGKANFLNLHATPLALQFPKAQEEQEKYSKTCASLDRKQNMVK